MKVYLVLVSALGSWTRPRPASLARHFIHGSPSAGSLSLNYSRQPKECHRWLKRLNANTNDRYNQGIRFFYNWGRWSRLWKNRIKAPVIGHLRVFSLLCSQFKFCRKCRKMEECWSQPQRLLLFGKQSLKNGWPTTGAITLFRAISCEIFHQPLLLHIKREWKNRRKIWNISYYDPQSNLSSF